MRRAMLTNRTVAGTFTVGDPAIDAGSGNASDFLVNLDNPAPRAGTILSASCYMGAATSAARIFTGVWNGSTFTVTAATGDLALAAGLNTFSVSLAIQSGGHVGLYSTGTSVRYGSGAGAQCLRSTFGTAPAAGAVYSSLTLDTLQLSIQGTGS